MFPDSLLVGCIEDLKEAWKKLRRRAPYKEVWQGGLYTIEVVNKGRGWHVHLHILVEGGYVSQRLLAADWKELTGDYIVDIREVEAIYGLKSPVSSNGTENWEVRSIHPHRMAPGADARPLVLPPDVSCTRAHRPRRRREVM